MRMLKDKKPIGDSCKTYQSGFITYAIVATSYLIIEIGMSGVAAASDCTASSILLMLSKVHLISISIY